MTPGSFEALVVDAQLARGFLLKGTERNMAEDRQILGAMAFAHAALIFAKIREKRCRAPNGGYSQSASGSIWRRGDVRRQPAKRRDNSVHRR
jgi:hypothetical protein